MPSFVSPTHPPFSPCSIAPCFSTLHLFYIFVFIFIFSAVFVDPKGKPCLQTQCSPNTAAFSVDQRSRKRCSFHHCKYHFCNGGSLFQSSHFAVSHSVCNITMQTAKTPAPTQHCRKWMIFAIIYLCCSRTWLHQGPFAQNTEQLYDQK